jgi:hypothetical protein
MKITKWSRTTEYSVEEAVEEAAMPSAYSYEGKLEKIEAENEKLRELVARLVHALNLNKEQLKEVLGYGWEVA